MLYARNPQVNSSDELDMAPNNRPVQAYVDFTQFNCNYAEFVEKKAQANTPTSPHMSNGKTLTDSTDSPQEKPVVLERRDSDTSSNQSDWEILR